MPLRNQFKFKSKNTCAFPFQNRSTLLLLLALFVTSVRRLNAANKLKLIFYKSGLLAFKLFLLYETVCSARLCIAAYTGYMHEVNAMRKKIWTKFGKVKSGTRKTSTIISNLKDCIENFLHQNFIAVRKQQNIFLSLQILVLFTSFETSSWDYILLQKKV